MIALFGGTFDPVHLGHLNMAEQCVAELGLSELRFLPCAIPVHKAQPKITDTHRLNMLELATQGKRAFTIDKRELERQGPSYSLLTLQEYRGEQPNSSIIFLMGMDSFNSLTSWYEWQAITQLCHIVVYQRPGEAYKPNPALANYMEQAQVETSELLLTKKAGHCHFLTGPSFDAASSDIRKLINNQKPMEQFLASSVIDYIRTHQLYAE
ncbi:nicotinate-nucleotide adenylyltransferase [Pseudoalteromonas phenolica]|uniref:Probable nicotinate-nucleotide adenylyltransferase n=1 Tax=Pseudoalteromonas phenolica TaxID=161398 RepID=A0A5S3YVU3_9GAMM|nr:nicotinate-nucleotide adenylyltransferase [Pseudoalteromonas phenolica]TMP82065.1 nicotinate-nucleotide adenylyltransferase [Pseudoalteromonas phenolica]